VNNTTMMNTTLDERVADELKAKYKTLLDEGKLIPNEQLEEYYKTFRNRFGPDKLKNLDGEELLNLMHDMGNKDSLVYWLEFKDDDEFPSTVFGSIAGGSSFKFGLFRKKETGRWTTGTPQKPVSLSIDQAIVMARRNRDQLLQGVKLLENMQVNGTDENYQQLQQDMKHVAPDVSDLAWGHKYFHLLFPEKLDDFHNPQYQRFHLIKLLQLPPQGEGRYIAGDRFVAIADELHIPMNHLTSMLNIRDGGTPYSYWRIGTSESERGQKEYWPIMKQGNYCAVRWPEVGDLTDITNDNEGQDHIRQVLEDRYPKETPQAIGKIIQQIWRFRWKMNPGDVVLATDGHTVIGIGRMTGGYRYDPTDHFPHRRDVEWLNFEEWKLPEPEASTTAYKLKKEINLIEVERHIIGASPKQSSITPNAPSGSSPSLFNTGLTSTPPRLKGIPARIQAILERKGQVILYGPPGTGKTYWAENTARELAARTNFNRTFEQLTKEEQALALGGVDQQGGFVRLCSFHPAYGYEDFLEGFRPEPVNGQLHFILRDGIFKKLCNDAEARPDHKFYLIIDEINRGDIPRIFGELLTVLEKDKRGKAILLPLTGRPFRVLGNVFIIGTMNTADRSIALLDTALRRRFGFIELMPDINILGDAMVGGIPLGAWLQALNERICECVGRDARNLQIGHSYLLEKGRPVGDFATFTKILQEDILPLLEEYCYEDYVTLEKILGPGMVDSKQQHIRQELFDQTNRDLLIQALLAPAPEITTSQQAISSEAKAVEEDEEADVDETGEHP
jgi:5-methylcytosine-specific restriction enzyme B